VTDIRYVLFTLLLLLQFGQCRLPDKMNCVQRTKMGACTPFTAYKLPVRCVGNGIQRLRYSGKNHLVSTSPGLGHGKAPAISCSILYSTCSISFYIVHFCRLVHVPLQWPHAAAPATGEQSSTAMVSYYTGRLAKCKRCTYLIYFGTCTGTDVTCTSL
jgi:hypothetical protein